MPNQAVLASAGIIAVTVTVAAAVAIYQSPEVRRAANDFRRRVAIALHSLGDSVNPPPGHDQPLFNRPEDAEHFLQSRGRGEAEMDADEESRRRQREELMYWNSIHMEKQQEESRRRSQESTSAEQNAQGRTFDDFLRQDNSGDHGTFVFNTGSQLRASDDGVMRRRGMADGVRGLNASIYANPFADEHGIDAEDHHDLLAPCRDEVESVDIYAATERDVPTAASVTFSPRPPAIKEEAADESSLATSAVIAAASASAVGPDVLFDFNDEETRTTSATTPTGDHRSVTMDGDELGETEYMTAGDHEDAFASIQAWAQSSSSDFYSPLPVSPAAPLSETSDPEVISAGQLTPTDSMSIVGHGDHSDKDSVSVVSAVSREDGRHYDVMSDDDGMVTPASWSEVGSVISENEGPIHA